MPRGEGMLRLERKTQGIVPLLLLTALVLHTGRCRKDDRGNGLLVIEDDTPPEKIAIPLDFLVMKAEGDIALMFGFELLQEVRDIHTQCDILISQGEQQFTNEMNELTQYYEDSMRIFSKPEMEEFANEDRQVIEDNLKKAMERLDFDRREKLEGIREVCRSLVDQLLTSKKAEGMEYVAYLLQHDPAQFASLCMHVSEYAKQIEMGVLYCQKVEEGNTKSDIGDPFDLCYGPEVAILVEFIHDFVAEAIGFAELFFGDDEDYAYDYSGGGQRSGDGPIPTVEDDESTPTDSEPTIVLLTLPTENTGSKMPTGGTEAGKTRPTTSTTPPSTTSIPDTDETQTRSTQTPTRPVQPRPPLTQLTTTAASPATEASTTPSRTDPSATTEGTPQGTVATRPTRPTTPRTQPATQSTTTQPPTEGAAPEWVDDAFNDVNFYPGNDVDPDSKAQRKGGSDGPEGDDTDPDVGGDGGEDDDGEFEIAGHVEIIYDSYGNLSHDYDNTEYEDNDKDGDEDGDEDKGHSQYLLVFTIVTIGLLLTMLVVVLVISLTIIRQRGQWSHDSPLLLEEEKISIMKQTGYLNPTYQFFDQATET